jgi:tricorn protease
VYASDPTGTDTSPNQHNYGRLGVRTERVERGLEIVSIIEQSPAAKGPMALQVGDVITAVEFDPIENGETLEMALRDRIGEETVISIERAMEDGETKSFSVFLTPISFGAERQLAYEQWRRENARLVREWSDGRLGYIHIQGMNQPSLDVFERDLFAAAEGTRGRCRAAPRGRTPGITRRIDCSSSGTRCP